MLPPDLQAAEAELLASLRSALGADSRGRWTVDLRFEGLRLLPVVARLGERLVALGLEPRLLFPDAGAAALARRDAAGLSERVASFGDQLRRQREQGAAGHELLVLVAASQAEYEEVEQLCSAHSGAVVLINPTLEDAAVGIGSVARQRRRGLLAGLQTAYALIPQAGCALRRAHPGEWELYRLDPDGYRFRATFERRPDAEQQDAALRDGGEPGLSAQLRSLEQLLEGLQN